MNKGRFAVFGLLLAGGLAAAVTSLVAQSPAPEARAREQARPRVMMLDGRGSQLGVSVRDLDGGQVRIDDVDRDSPAEKAGVREGDLVLEFDGQKVRSARQFSRLVQETAEGHSVPMVVQRDGKPETLTVTPDTRHTFNFDIDGDRIARDVERSMRDLEPRLRELEPKLWDLEPRLRELEPRLREFRFKAPGFDFDPDMIPGLPLGPRGRLGVQIEELTPQLGEYFGAKDGGVLVSSVTPDSPAQKAGLKAGDVITAVNGDRVRDYRELVDEIGSTEQNEVTLGVLRDKKELTIKATLPAERERSRTRMRRPA